MTHVSLLTSRCPLRAATAINHVYDCPREPFDDPPTPSYNSRMSLMAKLSISIATAGMACALSASTLKAETQDIDVAKMSCKEFVTLSKERISSVTMWLDGYYTEEQDSKLIAFDDVRANAEKLVTFCTQNAKATVLTASESIFLK